MIMIKHMIWRIAFRKGRKMKYITDEIYCESQALIDLINNLYSPTRVKEIENLSFEICEQRDIVAQLFKDTYNIEDIEARTIMFIVKDYLIFLLSMKKRKTLKMKDLNEIYNLFGYTMEEIKNE